MINPFSYEAIWGNPKDSAKTVHTDLNSLERRHGRPLTRDSFVYSTPTKRPGLLQRITSRLSGSSTPPPTPSRSGITIAPATPTPTVTPASSTPAKGTPGRPRPVRFTVTDAPGPSSKCRGIPLIGAILAIIIELSNETREKNEAKRNGKKGHSNTRMATNIGGAAVGAFVGTCAGGSIVPIVGHAVGALVGGVVGAKAGDITGEGAERLTGYDADAPIRHKKKPLSYQYMPYSPWYTPFMPFRY